MSYRVQVNQIDNSSFVTPTTTETGALVINSPKGVYRYCQSQADVLTSFGKPSALYPEVFEALAFCAKAPAHIFSAIHSDALYGGVDIAISGVTAFGTGRTPATFTFAGKPNVSHVFFAASPYTDDLSATITYLGGTSKVQFRLDLYQILSTGNSFLASYTYSLIREKDGYGKSLYWADVFKNDVYVIPMVNSSFAYTNYNLSGLVANFSGGTRGTSPTTADYTTAWQNFQYKNTYPAKIFMDVNGGSTATINSIIQNYQLYAHGISTIPMGNTASQAITYRQGLSLDTSNVSLYTNWVQIRDDYNNSYAWISDVGSMGGKYALMEDVYDAEAPAGIDETRGNPHGGQISTWTYVQKDQDYTDADLKALDTAQINPIINDPIYGRMAYGNKTLQASQSSTSFIGTRRMFNYIITGITTQIIPPQQFRINDASHRNKARVLTNNFLTPIANAGYLNDFDVICDLTNNTPTTLNARMFVITVYLQPTPDAEFIQLNINYVGNNVTIHSLIGAGS